MARSKTRRARKAIEIESVRPGPKGLIARIKGVTTREGAEALTGTKLYIGRDRLPPPAEDEWYHSDLVGLAAYDAFEVQIGTVVAVYNFGAGDIIEIKPISGGDNLLLPFTDATVPEIDTEERRLTLVLPETDEDERMTWRATVLTIMPDMFPGPLGLSLAGKALIDEKWSLAHHRHPRLRHRQASLRR